MHFESFIHMYYSFSASTHISKVFHGLLICLLICFYCLLRFADAMFICVNQICGYRHLCLEVEQCRSEAYSSGSRDHEKKLLQVSNYVAAPMEY